MTSIIILILLILAAFVFGWLVSRLLFNGGNSAGDGENITNLIAERQAELDACRNNTATLNSEILAKTKAIQSFAANEVATVSANLTEPVAVTAVPIANTLVESSRIDDLKIVEGIGPKIEELLHNAGIKTYAQLAASSVQSINAILEAAGPRYQMHNPGTWAQQAGLANNGQWNELKILQDELNKGKVV